MNHEFRVTVVSSTKAGLEAAAIARADKFFGPGNWRELDAAFVTETFASNYAGEYYFTDAPESDERTRAGDAL